MEPLLSVIVPIYKVEEYLENCVDSILNQTYKNLEIILVDDGSPDNCSAICDAYAAKDKRVKTIHKKNGGLSDARNAGMKIATGEYLMFVDSDDLLPSHAVRTLMDIAINDEIDLVIGGHIRFEEDPPEMSNTSSSGFALLSPEAAMLDMLKNGCSAWGRVYRRSVHQSIQFPVGEINEDEAIVLQIYEQCRKIAKTDEVVYYYRFRPESITTASFSKKKLAWQKHCLANLHFIQNKYPDLETKAAERYRGCLLWSLTEMALSDDDYTAQITELLGELKRHKTLFRKTEFEYSQDRIRLWVLTHLPFGLYKRMIRLKRNRH